MRNGNFSKNVELFTLLKIKRPIKVGIEKTNSDLLHLSKDWKKRCKLLKAKHKLEIGGIRISPKKIVKDKKRAS